MSTNLLSLFLLLLCFISLTGCRRGELDVEFQVKLGEKKTSRGAIKYFDKSQLREKLKRLINEVFSQEEDGMTASLKLSISRTAISELKTQTSGTLSVPIEVSTEWGPAYLVRRGSGRTEYVIGEPSGGFAESPKAAVEILLEDFFEALDTMDESIKGIALSNQ